MLVEGANSPTTPNADEILDGQADPRGARRDGQRRRRRSSPTSSGCRTSSTSAGTRTRSTTSSSRSCATPTARCRRRRRRTRSRCGSRPTSSASSACVAAARTRGYVDLARRATVAGTARPGGSRSSQPSGVPCRWIRRNPPCRRSGVFGTPAAVARSRRRGAGLDTCRNSLWRASRSRSRAAASARTRAGRAPGSRTGSPGSPRARPRPRSSAGSRRAPRRELVLGLGLVAERLFEGRLGAGSSVTGRRALASPAARRAAAPARGRLGPGLVGHERLVLEHRLGARAVVGLEGGVALGGPSNGRPTRRPRRRWDLDQPRAAPRPARRRRPAVRCLGLRLVLTASRPERLGFLVAQLVLGRPVPALEARGARGWRPREPPSAPKA